MAKELCLELVKGVLPVLEEITDPALLLFALEKAKGVLEDRASFMLILDPATWWSWCPSWRYWSRRT